MAYVLVVEDDEELLDLLVCELEDMGHRVVSATNGAEGLKQAGTQPPDIILSDINMPQMNGYQFRRKLTETHPKLSKLPFIFVSAYAEESDIADGLITGADYYITKPIDFRMLEGRIKSLT